jgi:hypothetical protein
MPTFKCEQARGSIDGIMASEEKRESGMSRQRADVTKGNGHVNTYFLCALCPAPALLACVVETTAFGVGDVRIYLCQNDYSRLLTGQQARLDLQSNAEHAASKIAQTQQAILNAALQHYGGVWPPRDQLWRVYHVAEERYEEARRNYRATDDENPEGRLARLRTLHKAGECLALAMCVEARAKLDGTSDSAVSGALARMTMAFLSGGLVMRRKEITRPEVVAAALAIMRVRARQSEDEAVELVAVEESLESLRREPL